MSVDGEQERNIELEVIDILVLLLLIGGGFIVLRWLSSKNESHKETSALKTVPPPALGQGDIPIAERLTTYYRLSQRSVRVLDRLVNDYSVGPMLSEEDKMKAKKIINDFYDEEGIKNEN
jgi:hypothetical protein